MLMPWVQGKTDDESALKNGGVTSHAPGEAIQSFILRSHLEKETFTNGGGKISSGNPLIIFTFGDLDCQEDTGQGKKDIVCTIYKRHSRRARSPDLSRALLKLP